MVRKFAPAFIRFGWLAGVRINFIANWFIYIPLAIWEPTVAQRLWQWAGNPSQRQGSNPGLDYFVTRTFLTLVNLSNLLIFRFARDMQRSHDMCKSVHK